MLSNRLSNGLGRKVMKDWKKAEREERKQIIGGNDKEEYWQRCVNILDNYLRDRIKTKEVIQAFGSYIGCQDKERIFGPYIINGMEEIIQLRLLP